MACSQLVFFLTLSCLLVAAVEIQKPRGVPLTNRHFYEESKPFTCLDGTKTISFDRVNDDYCDCKDGSDEPGTSACPNGNFFCANTGYKAQFIPSSRVNDGICDCCDTTDEYNSGAVCENTCKELGRKERESLEKIREITREGFLLKQQLIEEAKKSREEKQRTLGELQESKKGKEEQVEAFRTVKETAEQPEKEARERHLKAWEEQKEGLRVEKEKAKMAEVFLELDDDADGLVSVSELQTHVELDPDSDGTLSDTEAQELLGGSTQVDTAAFQNTVWNNIKDKYKSESQHEGLAPPPEESRDPSLDNESDSHYPDEDGGEEEEDDDDEEDDEDHEDDDKTPPVGRPSEKAEEEEPAMPPYDEETQALIDAAQKARDDFNEAEKGLREVEDQIKSLEKEISFDFGPSAEFSYLYNQCYELTTSEYIYRLCPFNRVSQKSKYGGSETNLGSWGLWAGPEDKKYSVMKYEHGTGCWQGPNRSTVVKLTCGKETTVVSTTEPSRCEYLMEFTTPAICQEPQPSDLFPHDEF